MIYAHGPAGYIVSKVLYSGFKKSNVSKNQFVFWGIFGAIAPDFDLLYYYTIGMGGGGHHDYFTHYPVFWFYFMFLSVWFVIITRNKSRYAALAFIFILNGFIHTILDTVAGNTMLWLVPFSYMPVYGMEKFLPWSENVTEIIIVVFAYLIWLINSIKTILLKINKHVTKYRSI